MNKIDDFYKKKEALEEIKNILIHYRLYDINIVEENNSVSLHLHFTSSINHVYKEYLTRMYRILENLLIDEKTTIDFEYKVINKLETELEELRVDIIKDFNLGEVNKDENKD